jgi:hypothetical protein
MTTAEARQVAVVYRARFSALENFERSWERFFDKTAPPNQTVQAAESWLERDLVADQARAAGHLAAAGLATNAPPPALDVVELRAIEAGDMHDFRDPLLSPEQHAAICLRCQIGLRSRQLADDRAAALGKGPFPGLSMDQFADTTIRCDQCGQPEDHLAPDTCDTSFWHLPDIYLALHPGCTLADMGTLGPFMRGFLRRQRPDA